MSNKKHDSNEMVEGFIEECRELLERLEKSLLELEEDGEDGDSIPGIFRIFHTIKGNGALFGFPVISEFTHKVESVYSLVREKRLRVTKRLIDITLEVGDVIGAMLDYSEEVLEERPYPENIEQRISYILESFQKLMSSAVLENEIEDTKEEPVSEKTYWIRFAPPKDIYLRGMNPEKLVEDIKELGTAQTYPHTCPKVSQEEIDDEDVCTEFWDIILTTEKDQNDIDDIFIFAAAVSEIVVTLIDDSGEHYSEEEYKKIGEILLERGDLSKEELDTVLGSRKKMGEKLLESAVISKEQLESALAEQEYVRDLRKKRKDQEHASSIRVKSEKLDVLVNLVGELVTTQAGISQIASYENNSGLSSLTEQLKHLVDELRDVTMHMRMVPIGLTFGKFKRLVRDLSEELGKEIDLVIQGGDTELDKSVIEKLNDPLVHLVRNSIDHGIESSGTIKLSASQSGPNVLVRIEDNGRGIDPESVKKKAIEKGIILPDMKLSEKEIYNLIFEPGFSTAETVSALSGRGVGMDVVKKTIDGLGGAIEIDSIIGEGTTITMVLPLTLAIIEGLLVTIGGDKYIFPLSAVEECIESRKVKTEEQGGRRILNLRGEALPYVGLRDKFGLPQAKDDDLKEVVITNMQDMKIGFVVDEIIGNIQTVVKSLGRLYAGVEGFSGATILGDGSIAVILDVYTLGKQVVLSESRD